MKDHHMFVSAMNQLASFKRAPSVHKYSVHMLDVLLKATFGHSIFVAMTKKKWFSHVPRLTDECPLVVVHQEFTDFKPTGCYLIYHKYLNHQHYGVQLIFREGIVDDDEFVALSENFVGSSLKRQKHYQIQFGWVRGKGCFYPQIIHYLFYACAKLYRLDADMTPRMFEEFPLVSKLKTKARDFILYQLEIANGWRNQPPQPNTQLAMFDAYDIIGEIGKFEKLITVPSDQWVYTVHDMRQKFTERYHRPTNFDEDDLELARRVLDYTCTEPSQLIALFKEPIYFDPYEYDEKFWNNGRNFYFEIRRLSQMNLQILLQAATSAAT